MIVGFTGTQDGMTQDQRLAFQNLLASLVVGARARQLHHGNCIGADDEAVEDAHALRLFTVAWPGPSMKKRGTRVSSDTRSALPYLVRNKIIAREVDVLIAAPKQETEIVRSGTWATVRYAREAGKPIYIIRPDGSISEERP